MKRKKASIVIGAIVILVCSFTGCLESPTGKTADILISNELITQFRQKDMDELNWYLQASCEWDSRVSEKGSEYTLQQPSDHEGEGFFYRVKVFPEGYGPLERIRGMQEVRPSEEAQSFGLKLYKISLSKREGIYSSAVFLNFEDRFGVLIQEQSDDADRSWTKKMIQELPVLFEPAEKQRENVRNTSVIHMQAARLDVLDRSEEGIYLINGYANPGEDGVCFFRFVDLDDNHVVMDTEQYAKETFRIGWSDSEEEKFMFRKESVPLMAEERDTFPGAVELWFRSDRDASERCLARQEHIFSVLEGMY